MTGKRPLGPVFRNADDDEWPDVFDVCDCAADPAMAWHVDGEWQFMYPITSERNVDADHAEYVARRANAWMVGCPQCGRVYARGW